MVLRRAVRFGRKIGFTQPFMDEVAKVVIGMSGEVFPELEKRREFILTTIRQEEERFLRTVDTGLARLEQVIEQVREQGDTVISGEEAFRLYDTFGLPLEITRDVVEESGMMVDEEGYHVALEEQRERARAAEVFEMVDEDRLREYRELLEKLQGEGALGPDGVVSDPYESTEMETKVVALLRDGERVASVKQGDKVEVVLTATSFYVEAGGQVSDVGAITSFPDAGDEPVWEISIHGTLQPVEGLVVHLGKVALGTPKEGDAAWALVDYELRMDIARNHTATHLLHHELRAILGEHVQQAGSLVAPDRLRFDFTHSEAVTQEQLDRIAKGVNDAILVDYPVIWEHESYRDALDGGVIALFGEKYGEVVRVMRIGAPGEAFSQELCGGTHVDRTSDIGFFHIISEQGIGAGVRRIEAVTGRGATEWVEAHLRVLDETAELLACQPDQVGEKVAGLVRELGEARKEIARLQQKLARQDFEQLVDQMQEVAGVSLLAVRVDVPDREVLREMTDWYRGQVSSGVVILGTVLDGQPALVAAVTPDLVERGLDAVQLVRAVAAEVGGGGGGRPTLAQAGGKDASKLDDALRKAPQLLEEQLEK
jgi:alanyl-tRNA synthetase